MSQESRKQLAQMLRRLLEEPAVDKASLVRWNDQASKVYDWVMPRLKEVDPLPHAFWHFLSDEDVRMKSQVVRINQGEDLLKLIQVLENGDS